MLRLLLALTLCAAPAFAADTYSVDGSHSAVLFRIKHVNISYFYGRFNKLSGSVTWDADPTKCSISIDVEAGSVDTGHTKRDKHVKSSDFLDANQYPKLSFRSSSVHATKDPKVFKVMGKLTCHGVTKDVSMSFEATGAGEDPWGFMRVGGEATLNIKRSDFGMSKMQDKLGDDVRLIISISAKRPKAKK